MTLSETRAAGQELKTLCKQNHWQSSEHMRPYLIMFKGLVRELELMQVSVRIQRSKLHHFYFYQHPQQMVHRSLQVQGQIIILPPAEST